MTLNKLGFSVAMCLVAVSGVVRAADVRVTDRADRRGDVVSAVRRDNDRADRRGDVVRGDVVSAVRWDNVNRAVRV